LELKQAIEKRTSVRRFKNEKIPISDLKELVLLAGKAPSINNSQPWKFLVVTNDELLMKMADAVHSKIKNIFPLSEDSADIKLREKVDRFSTFFVEAPALMAVLNQPYYAEADEINCDNLSPRELNQLRNYPDIQSVGAAVQNLLLAAVDMDYGACWLSGLMVAKKELEILLTVKEPFSLATCVAIGKPTSDIKTVKDKKSIEEIFELID
jgi:nitroreductase